jgi:RNA polymerase sigma-70 factor (ECF subfamily)
LTDHELLERLRGGDQAAFDSIFHAYYARLVQLAQGMLGERAPAEEIAQDVMLEVWRRRKTLTVDTSLHGYLFRATRNRTLNHLRHEKVVQHGSVYAAEETVALPVGERELVEHEIDVALKQALSELPPRCREVFELSRMHGLKYAEIAATLDISIKTVEAQMGKALRILREQLAGFLPKKTDI